MLCCVFSIQYYYSLGYDDNFNCYKNNTIIIKYFQKQVLWFYLKKIMIRYISIPDNFRINFWGFFIGFKSSGENPHGIRIRYTNWVKSIGNNHLVFFLYLYYNFLSIFWMKFWKKMVVSSFFFFIVFINFYRYFLIFNPFFLGFNS